MFKEFLEKIRRKITVRISLPADKIQDAALRRGAEHLTDLKVWYENDRIMIDGNMDKVVSLHFQLALRPAAVSGRTVTFEADGSTLEVDLNEIERIKKVPLAKIHDFKVEDGKFIIKVGL